MVLWKATLSQKRAIVETKGIGLTSADMPIPDMLGDGRQSVLLTIPIYTWLCEIPPLPKS